jgi:hypothetical protein
MFDLHTLQKLALYLVPEIIVFKPDQLDDGFGKLEIDFLPSSCRCSILSSTTKSPCPPTPD